MDQLRNILLLMSSSWGSMLAILGTVGVEGSGVVCSVVVCPVVVCSVVVWSEVVVVVVVVAGSEEAVVVVFVVDDSVVVGVVVVCTVSTIGRGATSVSCVGWAFVDSSDFAGSTDCEV